MSTMEPTPAVGAQPMTPEQVARSMEYTIYGVPIGVLGLDGDHDGFAAMTGDRRRAIAAACRYWRSEGNGRAHKLDVEGPLWVRFFDRCGCPPHEPDPDAWHDDCPCDHIGLPPCREEEFSWIYEKSTADAENAVCLFHIQVVDW